MITKEKIKIYKEYKGDSDMSIRSNHNSESIFSDEEWILIENLINDIRLIKRGLASDLYTTEINKRLKKNCDSEETIQFLSKLAINSSI